LSPQPVFRIHQTMIREARRCRSPSCSAASSTRHSPSGYAADVGRPAPANWCGCWCRWAATASRRWSVCTASPCGCDRCPTTAHCL